ncbi:TPA: SGNH/GDSL hydrolase family protein [Pseudomonas putida]|uniref:SGNH/GDSL hydrolase family protein n=1 Tax=Pseudomonas putida TaxID=303 RepID=UPI0023642204|nr:SGNH/GDSL hydrolase family protein [Pseudomonas putida]MDD2153344.1 SGNH/GDSL hydrolase family protein [Pseudomonas putida]HDS1681256.1 SGNH/GDSL hydrolase family protein [Pseudomonas putida]
MRYNTGNPVGPDGSNSPFDLYDNSGIIDLLLTGPHVEYLDRLGVPLKSWRGIMQQVTDYLIAQGYESIYLNYGAGVVIERQTQLVQRDGELYRVMDAIDIPLTLTGTWSTDAPKLQAVGDSALRQLLASPEGARHIGSVNGPVSSALQTNLFGYEYEAEALPWGSGEITSHDQLMIGNGTFYRYIGDALPWPLTGAFESQPAGIWVQADGNMSAHAPGPLKLADLTAAIRTGLSVVITGDSLSFNAYEFPSGDPLLPASYAYENPYGLASWGHMIRDSIYASGFDFTLAKNCQILTSAGVSELVNPGTPYTAPYNNQMRVFSVGSTTDEIKIRLNNIYNEANGLRLMFMTAPTTDGPIAKFDIYTGGVLRKSIDTQQIPTADNYRGRFQVNIDGVEVGGDTDVTIKNVRRSDGSPGSAIVQFIGYTTVAPTVRMTGHGGWTSGQVLADYTNMLGQYAPDLVFLQIGANDIGLLVPVATFKANVEQIIKNIREDKPAADIVLVTTTPMDSYPNRYSLAGRYCDALYQIATKYRCYFVNLYDVFEHIPAAVWRHDNVHTTIAGGNYVYKAVRDAVFPSMKLAAGYIDDAQFNVVASVNQPSPQVSSALISFGASGDVNALPEAVARLISVSVEENGEVTITPKGGVTVIRADFVVAPPGQFYMCGIKSTGSGGSAVVSTVNVLNNPPVLVTAKAQIANQFMLISLGQGRTY